MFKHSYKFIVLLIIISQVLIIWKQNQHYRLLLIGVVMDKSILMCFIGEFTAHIIIVKLLINYSFSFYRYKDLYSCYFFYYNRVINSKSKNSGSELFLTVSYYYIIRTDLIIILYILGYSTMLWFLRLCLRKSNFCL